MVALEVLFSLRKGKKASELLNVFIPLPQILENIVVKDKNIIDRSKCKMAIKKAVRLMKDHGRLLVRKSGTEPKIRIMGESHNKKLILTSLISKLLTVFVYCYHVQTHTNLVVDQSK